MCLIDALLELVAVLVGTSVCASFSVNAPTRVTRSVDSETGSDDGFAPSAISSNVSDDGVLARGRAAESLDAAVGRERRRPKGYRRGPS